MFIRIYRLLRTPLAVIMLLLLPTLACGSDTGQPTEQSSSTVKQANIESVQAPSSTPITAEVNKNANLRSGPGTNFEIVGSAQAGQQVNLVSKNEAGDWYLLDSGQWIASFLVDGVSDISVASDSTATKVIVKPIVGNVWTGVKVYYGLGEHKAYGFEILGGSEDCTLIDRGIKVLYPDGSIEWKDRDYIVTSGLFFVQADDPQISTLEWREYSDCP